MNMDSPSSRQFQDENAGSGPTTPVLPRSCYLSSSSHSTSPRTSTIYHIYFNSISHVNFIITKSPEKHHPVYHVQNSYFTPGTPDLTLHAEYQIDLGLDIGDGNIVGPHPYHRQGPMLAAVRFSGSEHTALALRTLCPRSLVLVITTGRQETGEVVAAFATNGFRSWKKKGKLTILKDGLFGDGGKGFELMVLICGLTVMELERRRGMQWRYDQL
ncbi:hypothetical protein ACJ73_08766 [Blastomyces percursus]|uniref:Uncharacterized protein n=1 Tax=Blastomyces percursus TaxID=1658174 RepID=A0A1J9QNV4_9EURO|nr:hypothetical protein ACJ73_08766 [Blastomyces percursus]